jgi:hypothetical protein
MEEGGGGGEAAAYFVYEDYYIGYAHMRVR